jgi:hypothetical protein
MIYLLKILNIYSKMFIILMRDFFITINIVFSLHTIK